MNTNDIETRLRQSIQREMMRCDPAITPALCRRTKTLDGYRAVEQAIIDLVISQHITPSAAIGLLESEWSTS
jgi:hypothetical protein